MWAGGGMPALRGLEWELNERGAGGNRHSGERGSDLVTQQISGRAGNGIRSLLGYLVTSKLIFHSASRQTR